MGHRIWVDFTITNNTIEVKPICWSPSERNFFRRKGPTLRELEGTGIICVAYPIIREPILIKSAKEERLQYVLYLPPGASLTFVVQLSRADNPEQFKGIIEKYPEGDAAPTSYFPLAGIYEMIGQLQDASSAYNTIIQKFPESLWADAARESLGAIRAKPVR